MQKIEPLFDFSSDKSNILIYQSKASICINNNTYSGNGDVRLELSPNAGIYLYGSFQGVPVVDAFNAHSGQENVAAFCINGHQIEGFKLSSGGNAGSQEFNLKWCPTSEPIKVIGTESTKMSYLIFHVFNFVNFIGTRSSVEENGTTSYRIEHLDLISDEWNIEIKSLYSTRDIYKMLSEKGGYRLTHIGCIRKDDRTSFTGKSATDCLNALKFFLSFAKGGWCEPVCSVGFNETGRRVWESWTSPREPWYVPFSWFDPHNSVQLATMFPSFMNKWQDSDWNEAFHEIIYWYLNANYSSRGIEPGIILTQAAIERLAFEYAVKTKKLVTVNGFKALWASDKFRLLFSSLEIPLEVPKYTSEIESLSKKFNWLDAPHALTEIRNSLVHPENKKRGRLDTVYYEAWNLGLWFLEMGILAICCFSGKYRNRLKKQRWIGQVEDVPWSKNKS